MNPPGRFIKQDPKTKLWYDIGKKAALAKTRQALREGAPELLMDLQTAEHVRETLTQDLNQVASIANITVSEQTKAALSNYLPRTESYTSLGSDSLLSLCSGSNGMIQLSGSVPTQVNNDFNGVPPSLASSSISSKHVDGNQFQMQLQAPSNNSFNAFEPVPKMLHFPNNMPSINQANTYANIQNMARENSRTGSRDSVANNINQQNNNALMALLSGVNSSNNTINENINQASQAAPPCAPQPGSLLQQLQSQIAYQQLLIQLGLPQSADADISNSHQNTMSSNVMAGPVWSGCFISLFDNDYCTPVDI